MTASGSHCRAWAWFGCIRRSSVSPSNRLPACLPCADAGSGAPEPAFHDALPSIEAGRASGAFGSAASRYYSAAGSDDDNASEWGDGAQSPPAGDSPQHPLLPLDLGSPEYKALLILRVQGRPRAGEGPSTRVRVTALGPGDVVATVDSIVIRGHLHGWEDAARCLHTYLLLSEQARLLRRVGGGGSKGPASPAPPAAAAAAAATPLAGATPPTSARGEARRSETPDAGGLAAQGQDGRPLFQLRASVEELIVEGVADRYQHSDDMGQEAPLVPAFSVHTRLALESRADGSGSRLALTLPAALVCMGVVPAGDDAHEVDLPASQALVGISQVSLQAVTSAASADPGKPSLWQDDF